MILRHHVLAVLAIVSVLLTACFPTPPPIPPPVNYIIKEIFYSSTPDPTGVHAPREPHSCQILVQPADPTGHAPYVVIDPLWKLNGWMFWTACVMAGHDLGRSVPAIKTTGDPNSIEMRPVYTFVLDRAPILGVGSGYYPNPDAQNTSAWQRAYIEASG